MKYFPIAMVFLISLLFTSCGEEANGLTVQEYITQNNLTTTELAEGVHVVIKEKGIGEPPTLDSSFKIKYVGMLTNGNVFDSNSKGFQGILRNMIRGWQIGLRAFGKGGKGTLIIPSTAGYGSRVTSRIPANSTLVFEIEVIDYN